MKRHIGVLLLTLASAVFVGVGCSFAPLPPKKNVLLITLDGLRQDHISVFGYPRQTTPNIDWLAANGVAFRNVVPTGCSTQVSLTSLFTSQQYADAQVEKGGVRLKAANVTLAETFAAAGYDTAGFVASPVLAAETRFGQGFAVYQDFHDTADYVTAERPVRAAIRYLEARDTTRPFFLYLHLEEPHPPWRHDSPWLEGEERAERFFDQGCTYMPTADELAQLDDRTKTNLIAKYDGALRYADEQIGHLLEQLRTSRALANTAVAVSTDHGLELVDRYSATHGHNPFDEVVRTFLILYDPSAPFADGISARTQARIFDIGPTLMALAHVEKPSTADGVDLLSRAASVPQYSFTRCYNAAVVRTLDYKLLDVDFSLARRKGDRLPVGLAEGRHLFALRTDPGERDNIVASNPRIAEEMERARELYGWDPPDPPDSNATATAPAVDSAMEERLRVLGY